MNHSTKNDQYWSFWCHWWSNHLHQDIFWENKAVEAVEAVEANEVAETTEVNEAAVFSKAAVKSLLRNSESSWFLNSIIWGLQYFSLVFWKKEFDRIMKTHVEFSVGGFWGQPMLLFLKTGRWNLNFQTSGIYKCLQAKSNLYISICQRHFKRNIPMWNTL